MLDHSFMVRSYGVGGGPHVIIVSAPVQKIGFWGFSDLVRPLGQDLGTVGTGDSDLDLGLTIMQCLRHLDSTQKKVWYIKIFLFWKNSLYTHDRGPEEPLARCQPTYALSKTNWIIDRYCLLLLYLSLCNGWELKLHAWYQGCYLINSIHGLPLLHLLVICVSFRDILRILTYFLHASNRIPDHN